jgi:YesN/AraC family two-component response regulator
MKIREVAEAVGILDAAYFCRFFKQHTSLTPNEFRKKSLS